MKRLRHLFVTSALCLLAVTPAVHAEKTDKDDIYRQLDLMAHVLERVRANYVEDVADKKLIESAISGMLSSLDPHSAYMSPKSFEEMKESTKGEFGGLGIEVTMEGGLVKVVSPIEGTPADRAGIQSGDLIVKIDDQDVQGMALNDAVDKMRGPVGSKIKIKVFRESEKKSFDVTIVRDKIRIRSVRWSLKDGGIGYVRITTFNEQVEELLPEAFKSLQKSNNDKPLEGLVLDLRNNPGGLLNEAIFVSDEFLNGGQIVSTRGRIESQNSIHEATKGDVLNGKPMVVLINGGSASASEIVSGALQDHKRAIVMGTKSFGKGSVQTILSLPDGAGMRLTTALYYTPSGRSIQAKGIVPDIEVRPAKVEQLDATPFTTEASLIGHLDNGNAKPDDKAKAAPKDDAKPTAKKDDEDKPYDYQLERALGVVKALSLWGDAKKS